MKMHLITAALTVAFSLHLSAQVTVSGVSGGSLQSQTPGPTGTLTGIVIDQDTQRPVRLAQVSLIPVRDPADNNRGGRFRGGVNTIARTGIDGTFTMEGVSTGDYYAIALDNGYVSETATLQAQFNAGANPADLIRQLPTAHVTADGNATVTITVQHGGAIGGRVEWEDGTLADGVQMSIEPAVPPQPMPAPLNTLSQFGGRSVSTDDRGDFRLPGLVTGDYLLSATISPGFNRFNPAPAIRIYAPGVFRKSEAKPISVRVGDERNDTRLVLDFSTLRKISGHISSSVSGVSVRSGNVSLQDSVDTSLRVFGIINANGDFTVANIPPGTYTMNIQGSSQERTTGRRPASTSESAVAFQPASQSMIIGSTDVSGIAITLNPTASH